MTKELFFFTEAFSKVPLKPSHLVHFNFSLIFRHLIYPQFSSSLLLHKNILKCRQSQTSLVSMWIRSDQNAWRVLFLPDQIIFDFVSLQNEKNIFFFWLYVTFYHRVIFLSVIQLYLLFSYLNRKMNLFKTNLPG